MMTKAYLFLIFSFQLMEIASAFGSLKAYHFETNASDASCAFLEVFLRFSLIDLLIVFLSCVTIEVL